MGARSSKVEAPSSANHGRGPAISLTTEQPEPTFPMMVFASGASQMRSMPPTDRHGFPLPPSQHPPANISTNLAKRSNLKTRVKKFLSRRKFRPGYNDNSSIQTSSILPTPPVELPSDGHQQRQQHLTVPRPPSTTGVSRILARDLGGRRPRSSPSAPRSEPRTGPDGDSSMDITSIAPTSVTEPSGTVGLVHDVDSEKLSTTASPKKSPILDARFPRPLRGKDSGYESTDTGPSTNVENPDIRPPSSLPLKNPTFQVDKLCVSIDFGTRYSGVSYVSSGTDKPHPIMSWPGSSDRIPKVPTCLVYDALGDVRAWGLQAKDITLQRGWMRCECFKLLLDPAAHGIQAFLPPRKRASDLVVDFLYSLWMHARNQILKKHNLSVLNCAEVYLMVPSSWGAHSSLLLREVAIKAGLVAQVSPEDTYWQERLHIIPETEASAIDCIFSREFDLQPSQSFVICNAGGGAVDLATYRMSSGLETSGIVEAGVRAGSYCGSLFLDLRFRELVWARLASHPSHLDEASLASFVLQFSESVKLGYRGPNDDAAMFHFMCLHPHDSHDPAIGLENGKLIFPGHVLRQEVFDPVINKVLDSIAHYIRSSESHIDVLLLVGGFSTNEYLFQQILGKFGPFIDRIIRPSDGILASCRGGARYSRSPLVTSVVLPQSVVRRVALPVEPVDKRMRPIYIKQVEDKIVCENRLAYILKKGDSVPKGSRVEIQLGKYCKGSRDRTFEFDLYTSNADRIMRYDDEGERDKLCRCVVDLQALPSFREKAEASPFAHFSIDFDLGLEMDTAEIRCVLLYRGEKFGSVSCDPGG